MCTTVAKETLEKAQKKMQHYTIIPSETHTADLTTWKISNKKGYRKPSKVIKVIIKRSKRP